jgi:hypothetical protein
MCSPHVVPQLDMSRVFDHSGVSEPVAVILGLSLRTVAASSSVRAMTRARRGGAIVIIGSAVRICTGPSAVGGAIPRIAEIVGQPSALAAAFSFDVRSHDRAATAGSCMPAAGAV